MTHALETADIEPEVNAEPPAGDADVVKARKYNRDVGWFGHRRRPIYGLIVLAYITAVVVGSAAYILSP
jgi:hypothetical protein